MGQGDQSNESAAEQAKDEQISDFIRGKYKDTTGSEFPVADKVCRSASDDASARVANRHFVGQELRCLIWVWNIARLYEYSEPGRSLLQLRAGWKRTRLQTVACPRMVETMAVVPKNLF